jgi:hypothetical protein
LGTSCVFAILFAFLFMDLAERALRMVRTLKLTQAGEPS